jgi:hypothetical protein
VGIYNPNEGRNMNVAPGDLVGMKTPGPPETPGSSYQQFRDELIGRIPVGNPDWTDHSAGRTETVGPNSSIGILGDMTETVGGNRTVHISGDRRESVGSGTLNISGDRTERVGSGTVTVSGGRKEKVGSNHAVVVGSSGEEIFIDKYGRIKVQFHWDRDGSNRGISPLAPVSAFDPNHPHLVFVSASGGLARAISSSFDTVFHHDSMPCAPNCDPPPSGEPTNDPNDVNR